MISQFGILFTGLSWWLIIPLAAVLGYLISRLYRRETEPVERVGAWIRGLRTAVVVLLALLLSQPVLNHVIADFQPPLVIVLRDASDSMLVCDAHEPIERQVRAAITLGLIDGKRRDTQNEQAMKALNAAQDHAESAAAGIRQTQELLQESNTNISAARDRVQDSAKELANALKEAGRAEQLLKSEKHGSPAVLKQAMETLTRLKTELGEIVIEKSGAAARLLDKSHSIRAAIKDMGNLSTEAGKLQDAADRALAEKGGPEVKAALAKLGKMDRATIIAAMLEKAAPSVGSRVKVQSYGFDTDLRELNPAGKDNAGNNKDSKDIKAKQPPENEKKKAESVVQDTDLATPLLHVAERHAQDTVTAVVVCTDGRHTSGPNPDDAARALAARGIAVHTLGVGSPDSPPDIAVARLDGTLSVFLDETIHLTAHIKVAGFNGKKGHLVLRRGDQVVQQRDIALGVNGWLHENFDLPADHAGPNVFSASVDLLPGEALTTNNSAEAVVDVANDRLKVLLVDELPRWESRYVGSLFRRDRKMTLDERWLQSGENLGRKPKALPDGQKALDEYDVVVLGDVQPGRLDEEAQKRLASYVADRGGFLVFIAGPDAMPRSYLSGPIADLLPIKLQPASASAVTSGETSGGVRVKLESAGNSSDIMRILRDPTLNEQLWPALPELHWVARPAYSKPGATTLLCTDDARKDAVVSVHSFGAGRVLYVGTDDCWRWRFKVADRVHGFFWSQAMRWGTSNRLIGDARLKAGTDRRQVRPGDNVEVLARPRDKDGHGVSDATVIAELDDADHPQRVQLQAVPDSGGLYRGYLQNVSAGIRTINVKVESPGFDGIKQQLQVIAHEIGGQEGVELTRDASRLASMAKAGGGRYLDILDAPSLFEQLAGQGKHTTVESSYELWSSYPALLLIVGLLTAEWLLRKKMGLA